MLDTKKPEKNYIKGLFIREHVFENGGKILKVSIMKDAVDQLLDLLNENNSNSLNLIIAKRKEVTDTGISHSTYVDPWKPEKKKDYNDTNDPQWDNKKSDEEDLPF